jgi:hypothetical protein
MPDNTTSWIIHFIPVLMMVGVLAINQTFTHQRVERRNDLEASRFRVALRAEMHALLDVYTTNLDLLARNCDYVLSARSMLVVYKGNLGRLTMLLDLAVIGQVVTAFAQNEKIESVLAVRAHPGNRPNCRIVLADMDLGELRRMYQAAAQDVAAACRALEGRELRDARMDAGVARPAVLMSAPT